MSDTDLFRRALLTGAGFTMGAMIGAGLLLLVARLARDLSLWGLG